jgi:hypothetical protein
LFILLIVISEFRHLQDIGNVSCLAAVYRNKTMMILALTFLEIRQWYWLGLASVVLTGQG